MKQATSLALANKPPKDHWNALRQGCPCRFDINIMAQRPFRHRLEGIEIECAVHHAQRDEQFLAHVLSKGQAGYFLQDIACQINAQVGI